jgi:predicted nucleic acid-binding protein
LILVDSSVWIDHRRAGNGQLRRLVDAGRVLTHFFIIGEVALGSIKQRDIVPVALSDLPRPQVSTDSEVLGFIERQNLFGRGIGCVDAHLLAAARLTAGAGIWKIVRKLHQVCVDLGLAMKGGVGPQVG